MTIALGMPDGRDHGVRLPIFYPSHIKLYLDCPERYYHKHVERRRGIEPFSRDLARGIATPRGPCRLLQPVQARRGFPFNLRERVTFQLQQCELSRGAEAPPATATQTT